MGWFCEQMETSRCHPLSSHGRRSDITFFVIHRKEHHLDGPRWLERRNEPTHDIDTQGRQTIGNQYPYITTYANHVMYFSWSTGNYQLYVLLRTFNPNNPFNNYSYNSNSDNTKERSLFIRWLLFSSQHSSLHGRLQNPYISFPYSAIVASHCSSHDLSLDIRTHATSFL